MPKSIPCTKWFFGVCRRNQHHANNKCMNKEKVNSKLSYKEIGDAIHVVKTIFSRRKQVSLQHVYHSTSVPLNKCLTSTCVSLQQVSHFNIICLTSTRLSLQRVSRDNKPKGTRQKGTKRDVRPSPHFMIYTK